MSRDVPFDEKNVSDLERSNSGLEDAKDAEIEDLGAGAALKQSGLFGKVNSFSLFNDT
jgi:hypothetical protein